MAETTTALIEHRSQVSEAARLKDRAIRREVEGIVETLKVARSQLRQLAADANNGISKDCRMHAQEAGDLAERVARIGVPQDPPASVPATAGLHEAVDEDLRQKIAEAREAEAEAGDSPSDEAA